MLTLETELLEDLSAELEATDQNFNKKLLTPKLRNAIREVKQARRYPKHYSDGMIADDMQNYYSNIRNIALYDYSIIGAEGQMTASENGNSRSYVDRKTLFNGILPLSRTGR